jgi:hypothetical protein
MRRAEALVPNPNARNATIAPVLEAILDDPNRTVACSETTLIEFHSNLTILWRNQDLPNCDEAWWDSCRDDVFSRIDGGRLRVLTTPPKAVEHVLSLVTVATRDHGRNLRSWDALHAVMAARWAHEEGQLVELVTSDKDFSAVLLIPGIDHFVSVLNLDVLALTGEGADKR